MPTDAPYGYAIVQEPMANQGMHMALGLDGRPHPMGPGAGRAPWSDRADAEAAAEHARAQFPDSRFVVCVLVPVEAGIQGRMMLDTEAGP